MAGYEPAQLLHEGLSSLVCTVLVDDGRESVHRLAVYEDIELDQGGRPEVDDLVVEGSVALARRLQPIVEIDHDLVEGQLVDERDRPSVDVLHPQLVAPAFLEQGQDRAQVL